MHFTNLKYLFLLFIVNLSFAQSESNNKIQHLEEQIKGENPSRVVELCETAISNFKSEKDTSNWLKAMLIKGKAYSSLTYYHKSMETYLKALEMAKEDGVKGHLNYRIAGVYYDINDFESAIVQFQKALEVFKSSDDKYYESRSYNMIGLAYTFSDNADSAILAYNKGLEITEEMKFDGMTSAIQNNLAIVYQRIGETDLALEFCIKALDWSLTNGSASGLAENYNNLGELYMDRKEYEKAKEVLQKARVFADSVSDLIRIKDNLGYLKRYYTEKGDYAKAYETQLEYEKFQKLIKPKGKFKVDQIVNDYLVSKKENEIKQRDHEIELLERQNKIDQFKKYALGGGVLLLGLVLFLIYSRLKSNNKRDREIHKAREELMQSELKNSTLEKDKLQSELEYKNRELVNFALHISQRNEMLKELTKTMKKLRIENGKNIQDLLNEELMQISSNLRISEDIENFQNKVEHVNHEFFFRLEQKFPNLTDNDRKLCSQLRLNLSSKEIASLNSITVRSVEVSRYRLRKKLGLVGEEGLTDFIRSI